MRHSNERNGLPAIPPESTNKAPVVPTLVAVAALLLLSSCAQDDLYKETRVIMGTYVTITVSKDGLDDLGVRKAVSDAFSEITLVDKLMSDYKPDSELSRANRQAGVAPVKVHPETIAAVKEAIYVSRLTGGAFDPTIGPLVLLWGIGRGKERVPALAEIASVRPLVDYRDIVLDEKGGTLFIRRKGMALDLGGIAKGYAADLAVNTLKRGGVKGGIVAVSGELKLFGVRPGGMPWSVGVQHPRRKDDMLTRFDLTDAATSTAGDYERCFIKDGVRYHHIMDPRTGYPARGLMSVTVVAKDSWLADSIGTGLFVLGPEADYKLAQKHPELEVLMVTEDGRVLATGRFKAMKVQM